MKGLPVGNEPAQVWDEGLNLGNPAVMDTSDEPSALALLPAQFRQQLQGVEEGRVWIEIVRGQHLVGQGVVDGSSTHESLAYREVAFHEGGL